jgi:hypothetical protein
MKLMLPSSSNSRLRSSVPSPPVPFYGLILIRLERKLFHRRLERKPAMGPNAIVGRSRQKILRFAFEQDEVRLILRGHFERLWRGSQGPQPLAVEQVDA